MSSSYIDSSSQSRDNVQAVTNGTHSASRNWPDLSLDGLYERLESCTEPKRIHAVMDELFIGLRNIRLRASQPEWTALVEQCRRHPLCQLVYEDPFTSRASSKPRGYAGDAVMMDYIYGREEQRQPPSATPLGSAIFDYTTAAPASEGVRARRAIIASRIDRLAEEMHRPNILAIAAGHLREVELSAAVRRRKIGKFVALDADPLSSAEVDQSYGRLGVETVTATFRRLLVDEEREKEFDLVYSTGLFDYLSQRAARRLVLSMFGMLRPGGSLLVANFLPGIRDLGYMESFMDWQLIYRNRCDMVDLTMDIPEEDVEQVTLLSEEARNILFLQVTRK
jgi:hypothetical protein